MNKKILIGSFVAIVLLFFAGFTPIIFAKQQDIINKTIETEGDIESLRSCRILTWKTPFWCVVCWIIVLIGGLTGNYFPNGQECKFWCEKTPGSCILCPSK